MIPRRLVGLLGTLLMFHLMLVGSDFVCAEHGVAGAHGAPTARPLPPSEAHQHHVLTTDTTDDAREAPCRVPTRPRCCEALASCTMSVALGGSSSRVDAHDDTLGTFAGAPHIPQSQAAGPEPPPPRA